MTKAFQILDWDTTFFGFPVGKVTSSDLSPDALRDVLADCLKEGLQLVYWSAHQPLELPENALGAMGGRLVDEKVTYLRQVELFSKSAFERTIDKVLDTEQTAPIQVSNTENIQLYLASTSTPELDALAIQCGEHSRFAVDPAISREKYEGMYLSWLANSLNKTMADEIFVVKEDGKIVGMVTAADKQGKGNIGLLAVDHKARRKGYGKALVSKVLHWSAEQGLLEASVVTQRANVEACRLYERCGYRLESVRYFYHFWLSRRL